MTIPRFYVDADLFAGAHGLLPLDQSRRARSVLRMSPGDELTLFNGSGVEAHAHVVGFQGASLAYAIHSASRPAREPAMSLTVALALLRGDRFDTAVQKLTEVGVTRIIPMRADRCVVSFDDARSWEKRRERYWRIAREAAEQSERVTIPDIAAPMSAREILSSAGTVALIERENAPLLSSISPVSPVVIAVGPEGGWTGEEIAVMQREGIQQVSMGPLILRAETAAIVAAGMLIQVGWQNRSDTG